MNRKILLLACLASLIPPSSFATQASLYLGGAVPTAELDLKQAGGGKDNTASPGGSVGGQLLYDFTKTVAAGIDVNYTRFGEKRSTKLSPVLDSTLNLKTTTIMIVGKWTALPDQKARPYLLGGIGMHTSSFKYEATPAAGWVWDRAGTAEKRTLLDDTKSGFATAFGIGLDIYLTPSVFIGGEGRIQYLGDVTWDTTTQGKAFGISSVKGDNMAVDLLAKLGFKF